MSNTLNYFTISFIIKLITGVALLYALIKLVKIFIHVETQLKQEVKTLKYLFNNYNILDFADDVDAFYIKSTKVLTITNGVYTIIIQQNLDNDDQYFFDINGFEFSTKDIENKYLKLTKNQYENIIETFEHLQIKLQ